MPTPKKGKQVAGSPSTLELLRWYEMGDRVRRLNFTSVIKHRIQLGRLGYWCEEPKQKRKLPEQVKVSDLVPTDFEDVLAYILDNLYKDRPSKILTYIADLMEGCMDERTLSRHAKEE